MAQGGALSESALRNELLNDSAVQDAVRRAGVKALQDPSVQQQILDTCRERFPQLAASVRDKVVDWAKDPEVQEQACRYAGVAWDFSLQLLGQSVEQVVGLVEQGPAGIRVIAFSAGFASCLKAVLSFTGVLNPISALSQGVFYMLHAYQMCFALSTMLFEAKPEWIAQIPGLDQYQNMLIEKAKFLTEVLGRGLFYGFQGSLWLSFASIQELLNFILGVWFVGLAILYSMLHCGYMPKDIAAKIRSVGESDYVLLPSEDVEHRHAAASAIAKLPPANVSHSERVMETPPEPLPASTAKGHDVEMIDNPPAVSLANETSTEHPMASLNSMEKPIVNLNSMESTFVNAPTDAVPAALKTEPGSGSVAAAADVSSMESKGNTNHLAQESKSEALAAERALLPVQTPQANKQKCCVLQ